MRTRAIVQRICKELIHDKRTLVLLFVAPLLVLSLMHLVFESDEKVTLNLGLENTSLTMFEEGSSSFYSVSLKKYDDVKNVAELIKKDKLDAFLRQNNNNTLDITYENSDPSKTAQIRNYVLQVLSKQTSQKMAEALKKLSGQAENEKEMKLSEHYLYGGKNTTFFDKIFPILIGFFVFFFVFLISGIALLRERTNGTLERMLATPIRRVEIVLGYLIGYGIFAVFQTIFIVLFSIMLLKVHVEGNLGIVLLSNILLAFVALSMGIFISTFANSEFQMVQFIPVVVVPQIFFSGIISLSSMNEWLQKFAYIFPLKYAGDTLTNVMIQGGNFSQNKGNFMVLLLFLILFSGLNVFGLKQYRKV